MNPSNQIAKSTKQQNLFNFDIGIFDSYSNLNCSINLHQKSFRYYKCRKQILVSFDPYIRLKQWAFKRIYFQSYKIKENADTVFVPQQLYKGNLLVMAAFLKQLKKKKVQSFISLHIINMDFGERYQKLQKCIFKLIINAKGYFFKILYQNYWSQYRRDEGTNPFKFTPKINKLNSLMNNKSQRKRHKSLSVQYTLVKIRPQGRKRTKQNQPLSLDKTKDKKDRGQALKLYTSTKNMYVFDIQGNTWRKEKLSKIVPKDQI